MPLKGLMNLCPQDGNPYSNGAEGPRYTIDQVQKRPRRSPWELIPVDGVVVGRHQCRQRSVRESIPVDKGNGGPCLCSHTESVRGFYLPGWVGEDTTLSQIIQMVSDAAATKAPIAKVADRVSGIFVPAVISIAVVTTLIWLLLGYDVGFALARRNLCTGDLLPLCLGLATPVAIMVGNGGAPSMASYSKVPFPWRTLAGPRLSSWTRRAPLQQGSPR